MITRLNLVRTAKLVALLGFLFPWVLVSCSGEPIAHLTGIDLATGGLTLPAVGKTAFQSGHPNLWVALSLVTVTAGILASFVMRGRQAIVAMAASAMIALAASAIGVSSVVSSAPAEPLPSPRANNPSLGQSSGLARVDLQYGYLMTVSGLLVAIGACGMALTGREAGSDSDLGRGNQR